jgi:hypothetical protein
LQAPSGKGTTARILRRKAAKLYRPRFFTAVIDKTDLALTHLGECIRYWLNNEGPNKQTFGERGYSLHGG